MEKKSQAEGASRRVAVKRQPGYYWVRLGTEDRWEVAQWDAEYGAWYAAGCESAMFDSILAEIDERRLERG